MTADTNRQMNSFLAQAIAGPPQRTGKNPRYADTPTSRQIAQIRRIANEGVERIRKDPNLTPKGKQAALARGWSTTREEIANLEKAERSGFIKRYNDIERQLFGAVTTGGASADAHRDATDRADALTSSSAAHKAMNDAERTGDTVLQRAIAFRAWQSGWGSVVDQYADGNTTTHERLQEMADLRDHLDARTLFTGLSKPSEISSLSPQQIHEHGQTTPELTTTGWDNLGAEVFAGRVQGTVTATQERAYREQSAAARQQEDPQS